MEKQSTGMYFSGHPMEEYREKLKSITHQNTLIINESVRKNEDGEYEHIRGGMNDGDSVILGGIIEKRQNKLTRAKSQMAYITLEDSYGSVEGLVFPKVLNRLSHYLTEGKIVLVLGTLSIREDETPKILVNSAEPLDAALEHEKLNKKDTVIKSPILYIRLETKNNEILNRVTETLAPFAGDTEVRLFFNDTRGMTRVPRRFFFNGSASGIRELQREFGAENVVMK